MLLLCLSLILVLSPSVFSESGPRRTQLMLVMLRRCEDRCHTAYSACNVKAKKGTATRDAIIAKMDVCTRELNDCTSACGRETCQEECAEYDTKCKSIVDPSEKKTCRKAYAKCVGRCFKSRINI